MLMDARLFLCQGFVLLRNPNSTYWDDNAEYVPSCSGLLHLAQPGAGGKMLHFGIQLDFFSCSFLLPFTYSLISCNV